MTTTESAQYLSDYSGGEFPPESLLHSRACAQQVRARCLAIARNWAKGNDMAFAGEARKIGHAFDAVVGGMTASK
jgi:hypothetical protein